MLRLPLGVHEEYKAYTWFAGRPQDGEVEEVAALHVVEPMVALVTRET